MPLNTDQEVDVTDNESTVGDIIEEFDDVDGIASMESISEDLTEMNKGNADLTKNERKN
jgi:hypothetical protein